MKIIKTLTYIFAIATASLSAETQTESPVKTPDAYSCDVVTKAAGMEIVGKMTALGKKTRTETKMHGMESITVVDMDTSETLVLMPAMKTATKMKMPAGANPESKEAPVVTWEKAGKEGDLVIWNSTTEVSGQKIVTKNWLNDKGYLVKTETEAGGVKTSIEYKNFKELKKGDVDAALFSTDAPEGYTVQNM